MSEENMPDKVVRGEVFDYVEATFMKMRRGDIPLLFVHQKGSPDWRVYKGKVEDHGNWEVTEGVAFSSFKEAHRFLEEKGWFILGESEERTFMHLPRGETSRITITSFLREGKVRWMGSFTLSYYPISVGDVSEWDTREEVIEALLAHGWVRPFEECLDGSGQLDVLHRLRLRLMMLAYAVQVNTKYCVFIDFSGHVDTLEVSIREGKERWQEEVAEANIWKMPDAYEQYDKDKMFWSLKKKIEVLETILQDGEIDTSGLEEEVISTIKYHF